MVLAICLLKEQTLHILSSDLRETRMRFEGVCCHSEESSETRAFQGNE
jgi:hypothetical protein